MFWFFFNCLLLLVLLVLDKIVGPSVDIIQFIANAAGLSRDMGIVMIGFVGLGGAILNILYTSNDTFRTLSVLMGLYFVWLSYSHGAFYWVPRAINDLHAVLRV